MKVTVILPIYNGEKTLEKTLLSLVNQTFQDFELIACIDGTFDGSEKILETYRESFSSLTILKNTNNLGLGPTMNRLVSKSKGKYIAVAEQDDYYYPNRLQLQLNLLDSNKEIGLVSGVAEFWDGENVTSRFPGFLVRKKQYPKGEEMFLLNYCNQVKVVNSCMMFRKSTHINNGLYFTKHYPSISVDWTYILRFSLVSHIYGIHDVLVKIDRSKNRGSVTSNKEKQFKAARELIRLMAYEYPDIVTPKIYKYALRTQILLEWSLNYNMKFYVKGFFYVIKFWFDVRFINKITNRLKQRF